ncbi:hypothetical protein LBMAG37_03260 [Anaerolineae bacterium]|nr:hypothetical protein LBMAG37_03260 [Anaerolineae bacterium]
MVAVIGADAVVTAEATGADAEATAVAGRRAVSATFLWQRNARKHPVLRGASAVIVAAQYLPGVWRVGKLPQAVGRAAGLVKPVIDSGLVCPEI